MASIVTVFCSVISFVLLFHSSRSQTDVPMNVTSTTQDLCLLPASDRTTNASVVFNITCTSGLDSKFEASSQAQSLGLKFQRMTNISYSNDSVYYLIVFDIQPEWKEKATPVLSVGTFHTGLPSNKSYEIIYVTPNEPPVVSNLTIRIKENTVDKQLWQIIVRDPDEGVMGRVTIKTKDMPHQLKLHSGAVSLNQFWIGQQDTFDAENYSVSPSSIYDGSETSFKLIATDGGGLTTTAWVVIIITDVNDNSPECRSRVKVVYGRSFGGNDMEPMLIAQKPQNLKGYGDHMSVMNVSHYCYDTDITGALRPPIYFVNKKDCNGALDVATDFPFGLTLRGEIPTNVTSCSVSVFVTDGKYGTVFDFVIAFKECPAVQDKHGYNWPKGFPGERTTVPCQPGYIGSAWRQCSLDGVYLRPLYNCTSTEIMQLFDQVATLRVNSSQAVSQLKNYTRTSTTPGTTRRTLYAGDLQKVSQVLVRLKPPRVKEENMTSDFFDVVNEMIDKENTDNWKSLVNETGYGTERIIQGVDLMVGNLARINVTADQKRKREFSKSNFYLSLESRDECETEIEFPDRSSETVPKWARQRQDNIRLPCRGSKNMTVSSAIFRNVSMMLSSKVADAFAPALGEVVNGPLMSLSLFTGQTDNVTIDQDNPVTITFQLFDKSLDFPHCSYWNFSNKNDGNGTWATDGCFLDTFDKVKGIVVCKCFHLTNFAILMRPTMDDATFSYSADHIKALSIISLVGCIVSMICLLITVIVYIRFWKLLASERSLLLVCLCATLFVAYLIFMAGIEQTNNQAACAAVAVLLHYFYLAVFFLMLAFGLVLAKSVLFPFYRRKLAHVFLATSYTIPGVIVGICMGATGMDGYGNKYFCWLSVDTGLIWAFIGPVIVTVLINIIIIVIVMRAIFGTVGMGKKSDKEKAIAGFRSLLVMVPVLGITWIFGIFAVNKATIVFQYLFALFNSIQGLLIMITNCFLDKKVQSALRPFVSRPFISASSQTPSTAPSDTTKDTKRTATTSM